MDMFSNLGGDTNFINMRAVSLYMPCLQSEQVVEDSADKVVVEEQARPGVPHEERQDGESRQLGISEKHEALSQPPVLDCYSLKYPPGHLG